MSRIFISYRRQDSALMTGRIYDRLENVFGGNRVFRDIDDINAGEDFRAKLAKEIDSCDILLVMIGPKWENITDAKGNRRLDDPNDFVRLEVEAGLKRKDKIVIPVLVENAQMPNSATLPESLHELCYRNAVSVRLDPDFHRDMQKLIQEIKTIDQAERPFYAKPPFLFAVGGFAILGVLILLLAGFLSNKNTSSPQASIANIEVSNSATSTLVDSIPITNTEFVNPTDTSTPTVTPSTTPSPTPTPVSGSVSFSSPDNPSTLNPALTWYQGGSTASSYDLELNPGWFSIISGREVDQVNTINSAPLILYKYSGNFEAKVKMEFVSTVCCQHAGIGVRSVEDPTTWLRIAKHENNGMRAAANEAGIVEWLDYAPYSNSVIYYKIERNGSFFNMSYSNDDIRWTTLEKNFAMKMPREVEIYLMVLSVHNGEGILAKFSDFTVIQK